MTFLRRLITAYRNVRDYSYDSFADLEDGWTPEDAALLESFFYGPTGQKLRARMTNYVIRCAINATQQTSNQIYHNGIARGIALSVSQVETHFASSARSQSTIESEPVPVGAAQFGIT